MGSGVRVGIGIGVKRVEAKGRRDKTPLPLFSMVKRVRVRVDSFYPLTAFTILKRGLVFLVRVDSFYPLTVCGVRGYSFGVRVRVRVRGKEVMGLRQNM